MRIPYLLFAATLCLSQSGLPSSQQPLTAELAIETIIARGMIDGHFDKVINGMGDPAAVIVTRVIAGRNLKPSDIDLVLLVLNMAFGEVTPGPDAEPKTALFVLRYLDLSTNDPQLRVRIEQTRMYVQVEYSKSLSVKPGLNLPPN